MEPSFGNRENLKLKELVAEASRALARLDSARLEELALSCQALNKDLAASGTEVDRVHLAFQAREAAGEMAVFSKVLDGTRANLNILRRLQDVRMGRLEYDGQPAAADAAWAPMESRHGDN